MDKKYLISKTKSKIQRRKNLNYIAFIKFLAMVKIIKYHIYPWKKLKIDYGIRMCELLFISSGFLVGYNYYQNNINCDYETSFKYTYKHLRKFYPLECINILYGFFQKHNKKYNNITEFEILLSNLLIIKSWTRHTKITQYFTGVSWFLSNLLFCYFLVPLLLKGINKLKNSLILFVIFSLIRISIEESIYNGAFNIFDVDFHRGPIIRLLEFYMGMLLIPSFFCIKKYLDLYQNKYWFIFIFTIIQISIPIISYYIMLIYNNNLYRCYFILIFSIFIFIIGYDYGILSILFAQKLFVKIMSCQMEMFLIQKTMNNIINEVKRKLKIQIIWNSEVVFLIKLLMIFEVGYLYKMMFKQRLAKFLDLIVSFIKNIFLY